MMRKKILVLTLCCSLSAAAQPHTAQTAAAQHTAEKEWRPVENCTERSTYRFVGNEVQKVLQEPVTDDRTVVLVVQENGINRLCVELDALLRKHYQQGQLTLSDVYAAMPMTNCMTEADAALTQTTAKADREAWRPELVLYPQVSLNNSSYDVVFKYAFNLAPSLEMKLWRGARLRTQVVLPIATNLHGRYRKIRPGVLAIEQQFALGGHWHGSLAAGNFTNERMGGMGALWWRSSTGRWEIGAEGGATVESIVLPKIGWRISDHVRYNGLLSAIHYVPRVNLFMKASAGRFVYGDWGVRGEVSRLFGECTIGAYGLYCEGENQFGFSVSVPLPTKRYPHNRGFRVRAAESFGLEYRVRTYGEFVDQRMGRTYDVHPERTLTQQCWQPDYIRYYLGKTVK